MAAKRRMSRREFLWASAIGSAGVVAAACQPAVPATGMADESDAAAPAMEAVEIRFSHWHGGFWDPIRDGIGEEHPEITAISESTPWGEYSTKLLTQMVGGVAPDVVMVDSYWQGEWFKVLLPLDDALDAHGVDNSKWDADPWMQCGNDGKIYSLSQIYCPNWQLVVNRTLAEQEGIDLPDWGDDGPAENYDEWRWDDLVEILKATTKVNADGEVEQWGLANSTARFGAASLYFMYSNGAQALDDLWGYNETEALIDSEESVQALQDYIDLTLVDKVAPTPAEAQAVQGGLFNSGKAFCTIRHPGVGDQRVNQEAFGLLFMPVPWREHRVQLMGTNSWGVWSGGENTDASSTFAIWATTSDTISDWITPNINLTGYDMRSAIDKLPALPEGWMRRFYEVFLSRDERFTTHPSAAENVLWMPRWYGRKARFFSDTVRREYDKVFLGEKSMQEAMSDAKVEIDAALAEG